MSNDDAIKPLRITLVVVGVLSIIGLPLFNVVWRSGWVWHATGHSDYFEMIEAVYATLGVFLLRAVRDPLRNLSLIWFTVWSSVAHGAVMAVRASLEPEQRGHFLGDIPSVFIIAAVLAVVTLRATRSGVAAPAGTTM